MRAAILTLTAVLAGAVLSAPVPVPRPLKLPIIIPGRGEVESVAFHPSGRLLAIGRFDQTTAVWEVAGRRQVANFPESSWLPHPLFSPDGRLLAIAEERAIRIWGVTARKELHLLTNRRKELYVRSMAFSPDSKSLAAGVNNDDVRIWDVESGKELAWFLGDGGGVDDHVTGVAFGPDGTSLAVSSAKLRLWDLKARKLRFTAALKDHCISSVAFSPDGKLIVTAGSKDHTARLWDAATGKEKGHLRNEGPVWYVAFRPDGRSLATAGREKAVRIWDVTTGKVTRTIEREAKPACLAFRPCGRCLAVGYDDGKVILWPVGDGK